MSVQANILRHIPEADWLADTDNLIQTYFGDQPDIQDTIEVLSLMRYRGAQGLDFNDVLNYRCQSGWYPGQAFVGENAPVFRYDRDDELHEFLNELLRIERDQPQHQDFVHDNTTGILWGLEVTPRTYTLPVPADALGVIRQCVSFVDWVRDVAYQSCDHDLYGYEREPFDTIFWQQRGELPSLPTLASSLAKPLVPVLLDRLAQELPLFESVVLDPTPGRHRVLCVSQEHGYVIDWSYAVA